MYEVSTGSWKPNLPHSLLCVKAYQIHFKVHANYCVGAQYIWVLLEAKK